MLRRLSYAFAAVSLIATPVLAQNTDTWTGEGTISAGLTSGNTETTDVGAGLKAARQFGPWRAKGQAAVDYGKNNRVEARNRWSLAGQLDRDLDERWYIYGRASYEQDKFSGFDSRFFLGAGAGYKVVLGTPMTWALEAGPGYRRDVIHFPKETEGKLGARIASLFTYKFNDSVNLSNDTEWIYSEVSAQLINIAAITAKMTDKLAARVSLEVRNESDPPFGRKATDTITRFSLVYGF